MMRKETGCNGSYTEVVLEWMRGMLAPPILRALYFIETGAVLISKIESFVSSFSLSTLKVVRAVLGLRFEDYFHEELLLLICDLILPCFLDCAISFCYSPSHRLVALNS